VSGSARADSARARAADCRVKIWNMERVWNEEREGPKMLCSNKDHSEPVNCVRWSPCGQFLATCAGDKMVFVLQMGAIFSKPIVMLGETEPNYCQLQECGRFYGHTHDVLHVAWCPTTAGQLASCGTDRNIFIWKMGSKEPVKRIETDMPCKGVSWDPMGKYLAAQMQGAEKTVCVWRVRGWKLEAKNVDGFDSPDDTQFLRPSWSPDGQYLATVNAYVNDSYVCTLLKRGDVMQDEQEWDRETNFKGWKAPVTVAAFHPKFLKKSGKTDFCVAVGSVEKILTVWSTTNLQKPLCVIKNLFVKEICDVTWGGINCYALSCCSIDGSVALIQVSAEEVGTIASEAEKKKELDEVYGGGADGLGDMDLPEDTAQMHYEEQNAVVAPVAAPRVQTVLTEKVVRAEQLESKGSNGRRKIAPAVTRQVSVAVTSSLEPAPADGAPAAGSAAASFAAPSAGSSAAQAIGGTASSSSAHLNGSLEGSSAGVRHEEETVVRGQVPRTAASAIGIQVVGGGFGAAGGSASFGAGGGEAHSSGGGGGGGGGGGPGNGTNVGVAENGGGGGALGAGKASQAGAEKQVAAGGVLGKRGAVGLKDGKDGKDASKARRQGVYARCLLMPLCVVQFVHSHGSSHERPRALKCAIARPRARTHTHIHTQGLRKQQSVVLQLLVPLYR
jgi:WD40 repeat protein